ncbi:MAG: DUF4013 domain-containing protein [archaeon]|nr:DUF4013 domain-containing protein [archaeon]
MKLTEIFKDSFNYAISDLKILLIIGVLFVIASLYKFVDGTLATILSIVAIIVALIIEGYNLSVINNTIEGSSDVPCLDPKENIIFGLKSIVVDLVYGLVIAIISLLVIGITFGGAALSGALSSLGNVTVNNSTELSQVLFANSVVGVLIISIVLIILVITIIFGIFFTMSRCRLAKYNSIGEALSFGSVFSDIKSIGIGRFIGWYILLLICTFIIAIVAAILSIIPFIGVFISALIASPIIALLSSRSLGLLYSEV